MMIQVLDKGYVKHIKTWGEEEEIIEAARMSTQKGFLGWENDEKLLRYLYNNQHMTPFEQVGMTIEVKAPIFVFREWHRHRTQSYNELSGRYTAIPNDNYMPSIVRIDESTKITSNKQSSGSTKEPDQALLENWQDRLAVLYEDIEEHYQNGLELGISRELARIILPVGRYSVMRANANLRNWLHFMTLRCDENAQWEIRQYANAVSDLIKESFPRTWGLWNANNN